MRITNACAVATVVAGLIACSDTSSISSPNDPTAAGLTKGPKSLPGRGPILFAASLTGDRELYSVNDDATGLQRLTFAPGYDDLAAYSPDGSKIVLASNRTIPGEVSHMGTRTLGQSARRARRHAGARGTSRFRARVWCAEPARERPAHASLLARPRAHEARQR